VNAATGDLRYSYPSGTVVGTDSHKLLIKLDSVPSWGVGSGPASGHDTARVALDHVTFAESFSGMHHRYVVGGAVGLTVGGVIGYVIGSAGGDKRVCPAGQNYNCQLVHDADKRPANAALFGVAGAASGAWVGYFIKSPRWIKLDVGSLEVKFGVR